MNGWKIRKISYVRQIENFHKVLWQEWLKVRKEAAKSVPSNERAHTFEQFRHCRSKNPTFEAKKSGT